MADMTQYGNQAAINRRRALADVLMTQYGNQAAINRRRALADVLMSGAMSGQSGMPQGGGRIASAAGLGAVVAPVAQALIASRMNKRADADESSMKAAYAQAMQGYTDQGMQALSGVPDRVVPAVEGVRPTNNPMPVLTGDQKSGYVDDLLGGLKDTTIKPASVERGIPGNPMLAATFFARNPETKALADELMKQAAAQYAPVDASKFLPYAPGQSLAQSIPAGGLNNANLGQALRGAFAGGGMPKIEGDRMIDQGTGGVSNLPMTATQQATANYNQGMLGYNQQNLQRQWAELQQRQQQFAIEAGLRRMGLSNDQARLELERAKADPAYQAQLAATVKKAEAGAQRSIDEGQKARDSLGGIDLINEMEALVPKTSDSAIGRGGRALGALFGAGGETRAADRQLEAIGHQLSLFAQRFPGVQTDKDYERMMAQVGVLSGWNTTQEEKAAALAAAKNYMLNLVKKYGTAEERAQAIKSMRSEEGTGGGWSMQRVE